MKTYKINNVEVSKEALQEIINSNPELLEKNEVKGRYYFPKNDEEYYMIMPFGQSIDKDEVKDLIKRFGSSGAFAKIGHSGMFKTKEDAQLAYDKQCAIVRCWKWAQEIAPFEPDWTTQHKNWHPSYNHHENCLDAMWHNDFQEQFTLPYFKSEEDCEAFIKANKADLELLFLK